MFTDDYTFYSLAFPPCVYPVGLLLKTMSRLEESIACYDTIYGQATSNHDKSVSMTLKADALVMTGAIDEAIDLYNDALQLTYYQHSIYLPLTQCYLEKGNLSKDMWQEFLVKMESAAESFNGGRNFITKEVKKDLKSSYLFSEVDTRLDVMRSEIFWAMHSAADKCKYALVGSACFAPQNNIVTALNTNSFPTFCNCLLFVFRTPNISIDTYFFMFRVSYWAMDLLILIVSARSLLRQGKISQGSQYL